MSKDLNLVQEAYPRFRDFEVAYYEMLDTSDEYLEANGALPAWALEAIYEYYKYSEVMPTTLAIDDLVDGFEVVLAKVWEHYSGPYIWVVCEKFGITGDYVLLDLARLGDEDDNN